MKKILLAFSGGLDTSYCARYFAVELGMKVHTVIVDTGGFSADDLQRIEQRAHACGAASHTTLDRTDELYSSVLRHCIAGNILKNSTYPLSVSAERIVQAIAIAQHALAIGATHLAHGSTGAGNDQVRFDVIFRILCPGIEVLTPIRDMQLSRDQEIAYLTQHGVDGDWAKAAYSINQGIWGTTIGGRETLTSDEPLPIDVWPSAVYPVPSDGAQTSIIIDFVKGQPTALDGVVMPPIQLLRTLNDVGSRWHIGRDMHVGDTIIGIKGRVAFEAPSALLLIKAHHALEKHTLSKWQLTLKDQLSIWYGQLLHEGQFLDPAMRSIEAFFDETQTSVTGQVVVRLMRERYSVEGIRSANDLMKSSFATYGEENKAWTGDDAKGFATISAVSSSLWMAVHGEKL
ncbi:MAG: argininosuccinate synthase [Candidatus Kapabacteria bacterium]|nr:argininosuccinate synthase [Candidatus Kapabacteria bacterium]